MHEPDADFGTGRAPHKYSLKASSSFWTGTLLQGTLALGARAEMVTSRSCCPVQIQKEIHTFLSPALGASDSKQLREKRAPAFRGPWSSKEAACLPGAIPLSRCGAWKNLSGGVGDEQKEEGGMDGSPHPYRQRTPGPLHQPLSKAFTGQAWKNYSWIFIMVKLLIYEKCCRRWASPHETVPGAL